MQISRLSQPIRMNRFFVSRFQRVEMKWSTQVESVIIPSSCTPEAQKPGVNNSRVPAIDDARNYETQEARGDVCLGGEAAALVTRNKRERGMGVMGERADYWNRIPATAPRQWQGGALDSREMIENKPRSSQYALTTTVLVAEVRESPHISEIDGEPDDRQQEIELPRPSLPAVAGADALHGIFYHRRRHHFRYLQSSGNKYAIYGS